MKLIILAAGQGSRLRPLTDDRPKALVELCGRPLLDWQLRAARDAGLEEIVVVGGYRADMLLGFGTKVVVNDAYETTNMVQSLFCAQEHFGNDFVMSYGDIVYSSGVLAQLMETANPISVVVDEQFRPYWTERFKNPLSDAESLVIGPDGAISSIGQRAAALDDIQAQYIGLVRFRDGGVRQLREVFEAAREGRLASPTGAMLDFDTMYMTDLLQGIADQFHGLSAVKIQGGWLEIDSADDLRIAEKHARQDGLICR